MCLHADDERIPYAATQVTPLSKLFCELLDGFQKWFKFFVVLPGG
jgi:hypothetical protein